MSRLVSKILLSIFMFPLAGVFYTVVAVGTAEMLRRSPYRGYQTRELGMFLTSGVLTWAAVAVYWCLLWRSGVAWTALRVTRTLLAAIGALVVGLIAGVITAGAISGGEGFGAFVGGVLAILLWLIATVFTWRETAAERAKRVAGSSRSAVSCPTCGYNLTGLTESRCPECGSTFTLDELIALQQPKTEVEIE